MSATVQTLEKHARDALRRGNHGLAQNIANQLTACTDSARVWMLDGDVAAALGDWDRALRSSLRAIELGAKTAMNWLRAASAYRALAQWQLTEESLAAAEAAAEKAEEHAALGDFYVRLEDYHRACTAYDRAVRHAPSNHRYLFNRAATRRFLGQLEEAEHDYDEIIARNPADCEAYLNRSGLRVQTPERNHVAELERQLMRGRSSWQGEVSLLYAMAKELEDLGEYRRSWKHLAAGASLRRRHLQYDVRTDVQTMDWIREAFPGRAASSGQGCPSAEPIFIVGMPRTGTTLLERILTNQPNVHAGGELRHLTDAVVAAAQRTAGRSELSRRELVQYSATVDFAALGADYLRRVRSSAGRHLRFTDKMPLNFLYCGIIRRALPNIRILHLTRHPLATCYAIYKTLFDRGYPFSYDLGEIAQYYIAYRKLMAHWHQTLPGGLLDVSYERLVIDAASEARCAFDFCGLDWDPRCLEFHRSVSVSTTASAAQIRRPIYQSSIAQWENFREELSPIVESLEAAGIDTEKRAESG